MAGMQGKVVAVTGAARGLGAALARQLTERGARVALLGLEPEELDAVSSSCPGSRWWEVDVTNSAALNDVAQELAEHFGRLDAVVINAGVASGGPFLHADPAAFDRTIEINLLGSVRTLRAFLPALVASKGYALQIASLAALAPAPMMAAYCASKSGVEAFAEIGAHRGRLARRGRRHRLPVLDRHRHGPRRRRAAPTWPMPARACRACSERPTRSSRRSHALCDGIERRAAHVYGQRWVRNVRPLRGLITGLLHLRRQAEGRAGREALPRRRTRRR